MNASTSPASLKAPLPNRPVTEGRACLGTFEWAPRSTAIDSYDDQIAFDAVEVFKKTPCVADLKPAGRDVAKDMREVGSLPLQMATWLGHGVLHRNIMAINADIGALDVKLTDEELAARQTNCKPRATNPVTGVFWKYAQQVGTAVNGAVTDPGGAHEKQCYADI